MERKCVMAFPSGSHLPSTPSCAAAGSSTAPVSPSRIGSPTPPPCQAPGEGEHQLEKLEFALAVALTKGDLHRSQLLREQIAALGGNREEPGT